MKLTAQDLQIGDWVMYDPNVFIEDEYVPTQEQYPIQIKNGEDIDLAIEGCYDPIPITTETLEKNGFEKIEEQCYGYSLIVEKYMESISVLLDERQHYVKVMVDSFVGEETEFFKFLGRAKCVHQLQQAMRLCHIKGKEIEL